MHPTLLVMAAGMGSRYGGLKQLDPVGPGGEALVAYSIYDAIRAGFGKVVIVLRPEIEGAFKEAIDKKVGGRIAVEYVYQKLDLLPVPFSVPPGRKKPWGTGHAILVAAEAVHESFAVINADNFYGARSFRLLGGYLKASKDPDVANYAMMGFVLQDTLSGFGGVSRAICERDAEGFLQSVIELTHIEQEGDRVQYTNEDGKKIPLTGDEMVSRNMWGFTPSIFTHLGREFMEFLEERGHDEKCEFLIPTVVGNLIAKRHARVTVLSSREQGFGITYRQDKPAVVKNIRDLVSRGIYPERLWL
ncbi:MAG: sugar phosphate nucleotidyltransferase [Candidatus Methylomirabilales bacterium]